MSSMKRLYRSFSKFVPDRYVKSAKQSLSYADADKDVYEWVGKYIFVGFMLSFLLYLFLSFILRTNLLMTAVVIVVTFALLQTLPRIMLDMTASKRANFVEGVLPDTLMLISSNMRSGMTPDKAIMLSARSEFGPLEKEIRNVAKKAMSGVRLDTALLDMAKGIRSETPDRTINLLVQGLRAGGEFAALLEQIALDIKDMQILKKEIRASVMMYSIFIMIAAGLGAPALFAVSTYLIEQITGISSGIDIPAMAMSNMPFQFSFGAPPVSPRFLFYFALACMLMSSIFASMIMGLIQNASARDGLKFIPLLMALSFGLFFLARGAVASIMGSMAI